jgi:hypothetical protein
MRIHEKCLQWLYIGLLFLDSVIEYIGNVVLAVLKRWEWCCVLVSALVIGYMVTHLEASLPVFLIGMAFAVPPFCFFPYILLNFGIVFPIHCVISLLSEKEGGMLSVKTYGPIVGWAVYLAYLAMLMHRPDEATIGDVIRGWAHEIMSVTPLPFDYRGTLVIPALVIQLVYLAVLSPILLAPIPLFLWTRWERMNPTFLTTASQEETTK